MWKEKQMVQMQTSSASVRALEALTRPLKIGCLIALN